MFKSNKCCKVYAILKMIRGVQNVLTIKKLILNATDKFLTNFEGHIKGYKIMSILFPWKMITYTTTGKDNPL